ncbi:MAG: RNA polymerase sigma factor [Paludibacteraceae bacterium]|nr:RNA polymerase sigma factor [Paludibacteraceae bacterium]
MSDKTSDIELMRRVLHEDDSRAFSALMQRYSSRVYGAALRLMHDEDKATEVVQLAFIQAYRHLQTWRGENFGAWVTTIATHLALRIVEKEKRLPTEPLDENTDQQDETYDEQQEQRLQTLEQAIAQLPDEERQIIQQHYYNGVPLATIAHQLGQTENNIKVRLFRIREKLKKKLAESPSN